MKTPTRIDRPLLALCIAGAALLGGCVSTDTFEKMQADKNRELADLQQQKSALEQQKAELESNKAALERQKAALERQKSDLEKQRAEQQQALVEQGREKALLEKQKAEQQAALATLEKQKNELEEANRQREAQHQALVRQLSEEVKKGDLKVRQYQNMLAVDVAEQIFFESGRADLKETGRAVMKKLAEALQGYADKQIRVIGHTDNVPLAKTRQNAFATNWELSVARATNVVRALQQAGVPPERMVASGRGEYAPLAPNDTPEGRKKNRRIEILLVDATLAEELSKPKGQ